MAGDKGRHISMKQKTIEGIEIGESETVEFKSSFDKDTIETLVAFANTTGGKVFIGVSDKGEIKGIKSGKETVQNWINQIKQFTSHAIIPDIETVTIKNKSIVIFSVQESPIKPVACRGRYYKRIKNANHQLSVSEVVNLHLKTFNTSWDFHIDEHHTEKDISFDKVQNFIEHTNTNRESPILDAPLTVLQKFELMREGKITYACFLLFMSVESSLSTIELGRFQTPTIIKDAMRFKTDLFTEVDGVMQFIQKHINKAYIITGRPQREERWDYPLDAIREIVVNAVIHRDYTSPQDSVVKIYDDKIEIFNPGKLPDGITVEKLLKGDYVSNTRNKKIADVFKAAGLIEKYGSGIRRILNAFKTYGMPAPEFREISGGFMVTVYKKAVSRVTEQVGTKLALSRHQVDILRKCLIETGIIELMTIAERTDRTKFRHQVLNLLIEARLLEMTIPNKPTSSKQKYRLTEEGEKLLEKLKNNE